MNIPNEVKKQAVDAISCVQTVAQIGAIKLTGGIALYAAHIRQVDKQAPQPRRQVRRDAVGREI